MKSPLRLIYMGTPEFALAPLKKLLQSDEELVAVITQPDRPRGRGQKLAPSPVKKLAQEHNLPVLQPESARQPEFIKEIQKMNLDLAVVCSYGQILPGELLEAPRLGSINIHASLLPKYRGPAPIPWALLNGEKETGITIMKMVEKLDAGPIILQKALPIESADTTGTLEQKLSLLGAELLIQAIQKLKTGEIEFIAQDESRVSYAPFIKKEQARIDWNEPAEILWRKIRAFNPRPGAFVGEGNHLIKIWRAEPSEQRGEPGVVLEAHKKWIEVACREGSLRILELQPAGKKPMSPEAFLAGHRINPGDKFPPTIK